MKTCRRCSIEQDESQFHKNGANGLHTVCKACALAKLAAARVANPDYYRELDRKRYERDREKRRAANVAYCEANKERRSALERNRYEEQAEAIKARNAAYRAANPDKVYEWNGTRRAMLRNALPPWACRKEIRAIYDEAKRLSRETGVEHHVDHDIPLAHPLVCGLHVPANLKVLTASENLAKQNRF